MKKIGKFLALSFLIAIMMSCTGIRGVLYDPPIPTHDYFPNTSFKLYIYSEEDFGKIVEFYFGSSDPACAGFTIRRPNGEKIIILPRDKDGRINLWSLGHEIFYHVIYDCGDSHKIPKKKE